MTEFLHGYDKQAQAKEVTLHFQMYARELCRDSWSFCHGQKKYLSYATSFMQLMSWLAFAKNILLELLTVVFHLRAHVRV